MAFINLKRKEIQLKIVYYGPSQGGKTTNLMYIYDNLKNQINSRMITINTFGDRTLFFDFLPFNLGKINGYGVKVQLYTVPGQIKYNATRKLVLNGVDGIVFVADMHESKRRHNIFALKNLYENLVGYKKSIFKLPLVFQFNKVDLAARGVPIISAGTLEDDLNRQLKKPIYKASALTGENVFNTLKMIIRNTCITVKDNLY